MWSGWETIFQGGVDFLEKKGEWVRITEPYSAHVLEGKANILKKVINPAQEKWNR